MLAVDLEAFLEVAADRDLEIEVAQRAIFEVDRDEPAIGTETFEQPGADADDRPAQEPRRIDQVAAVAPG